MTAHNFSSQTATMYLEVSIHKKEQVKKTKKKKKKKKTKTSE